MRTTYLYTVLANVFIMEKEIIITVKAPVECTDEQFQEWAEYCLGNRGVISVENPLHAYDLEASDVDVR